MTNENIKDDGGPAFPIPISTCYDGGIYNTLEQSCGKNGGMTLRDYFAGQALMGLRAAELDGNTALWTSEMVAKLSYLDADAMLEARKK